jgi:hypothetical protein
MIVAGPGATSFELSAPHVASPGGEVRSWIVTPPGMLNVVQQGVLFTAAMARFISVDVEAEMKRRHPQATKFIYVHDFSGAVGYEPEARRILTSWGLSRVSEAERVVIVTSPSTSLIRMAVSTAAVVLRVAGMDVEVADDLRRVMERYGVKA